MENGPWIFDDKGILKHNEHSWHHDSHTIYGKEFHVKREEEGQDLFP